jgi:glycogen synthase
MRVSVANLKGIEIGDVWFTESAGGLGRVHHELIKHLPAAGIDCFGLAVGSPRSDRDSGENVRIFSVPSASTFKRLLACRRFFNDIAKENEPDFIAAHFALYAAPMLDRLAQRPFIMHFHGPWAAESVYQNGQPVPGPSVWVKNCIERAVYSRADRVIVLSKFFGRIIQDDYGVSPDVITVIPGGVDVARFDVKISKEAARKQLGWTENEPVLVVVRRLVHRMGLENLIEAVGLLVSDNPNIRLKIAGRGPKENELRELISKLGLQSHVQLLGFVSDENLPLVYRAASFSIVPSVALEGFGLTTLESLAAGTPVLVTPVGGLPEAVAGLSEELIMPGYDVSSLAKSISSALSGKRRIPNSTECLAFATQRDWPIIAQRTAQVYREVVGAKVSAKKSD